MLEIFAGMNQMVFVWLVAVIVFLAVEISTVTLTSIWFAVSLLYIYAMTTAPIICIRFFCTKHGQIGTIFKSI